MTRLFIVGDSFSVPPKPQDTIKTTWTHLVHQGMIDRLGREVEYINCSLMGSSQEWAWKFLQIWLNGDATADDRIVVCLTHPSRVWYFEDNPALTNANIVDLDQHVTAEQARTVELYLKHIQRPEIDIQNVNNRMAYVAYQVLRNKLPKPLFIKCFSQDLAQSTEWPEINLADGVLMDDVQYWEFEDPNMDIDARFWNGLDSRYNHMCLSNHRVLADKILANLLDGEPVDLKQGFHRGLLTKDCLSDREFCRRELDLFTLDHNSKFRKKFAPTLPWAKRVGITTGMKLGPD